MKKTIAILLALVMCLGLIACGGSSSSSAPAATEAPAAEAPAAEAPAAEAPAAEPAAKSAPVAGLICLHDENSGYDANFINGFIAACEGLGVEYSIKKNIDDTNTEGYDAACELADDGCKVVFSDSYGHGSYLLQAAQEIPDVHFTSCTADNAKGAGLDNFHNAFAQIHNGRYIAGVAAGMKLAQMIEEGKCAADCKVGYVAAMPYAEVISGYTSWFLGVRSLCPDVTMDVTYTGTWLDETLEKEAAEKLISGGCVLISQHADSMGAPNACQAAGVPNVSYNGSTMAACPDTYIISSRIDWEPYFTYAIQCVLDGKGYETDWIGTLETGSVKVTELNENVAAPGTAEKLAEVEAALKDGTLHPFATENWTVNGEHLDTYDKAAFYEGNECIWDGYFHESETRSAPYFDLIIDGINVL